MGCYMYNLWVKYVLFVVFVKYQNLHHQIQLNFSYFYGGVYINKLNKLLLFK